MRSIKFPFSNGVRMVSSVGCQKQRCLVLYETLNSYPYTNASLFFLHCQSMAICTSPSNVKYCINPGPIARKNLKLENFHSRYLRRIVDCNQSSFSGSFDCQILMIMPVACESLSKVTSTPIFFHLYLHHATLLPSLAT